jgi:hypothetical protein
MSTRHCLGLVGTLVLAAPGCGDDCDEGYVDTFGFCTTEGLTFELADALTGAIVVLDAALDDAGTFACPDGGQVTIVDSGSTGCRDLVCSSDLTWTFAGCLLEHDTVRRLRVELTSGTIRDVSTSTLGRDTVFTHHLTGEATFDATVALKRRREAPGPRTCTMDFTHEAELLGETTVSGSLCDEAIQTPLYELGR